MGSRGGLGQAALPTVAILAGGLATRMHPATLQVAKSMLPLAGQPMLGHQLRLLARQGVAEVVLCCGHLEEQLRGYAGDGSRWGLRVLYTSDGPTPLGTGGALCAALPLLGERFLVLYGDSFVTAPLTPVWTAFVQSDREALMTVFQNEGQWDASNVRFEDGQILAYSKTERDPKMRHIDYGINCFAADAFRDWPFGARFDLADVQTGLLRRGQLAGFGMAERFYEIGSPTGFAETDAMLRRLA